jgi:hypothetical protein
MTDAPAGRETNLLVLHEQARTLEPVEVAGMVEYRHIASPPFGCSILRISAPTSECNEAAVGMASSIAASSTRAP